MHCTLHLTGNSLAGSQPAVGGEWAREAGLQMMTRWPKEDHPGEGPPELSWSMKPLYKINQVWCGGCCDSYTQSWLHPGRALVPPNCRAAADGRKLHGVLSPLREVLPVPSVCSPRVSSMRMDGPVCLGDTLWCHLWGPECSLGVGAFFCTCLDGG